MTESPPSGPAATPDVEREATERAIRAAAPTVAQVEVLGSFDLTTRRALYGLLSSIADNKYVLGRRYAEWCTGAPMLESAVAAAAMAQDELGHARSLYPLLRGFPAATEADTMEEAGWQSRPTSAMTCLDHPFTRWTEFIAANFLADTALTTLFEAATDSPYEPLRQRARKVVQEEAAHWVHAEGWVRRLAADEARRPGLSRDLARIWDDAFTWFGEADDEMFSQLGKAGLLASRPDALRKRLRSRLAPVIESTTLSTELSNRDMPWDRWDAASRRLRPEMP